VFEKYAGPIVVLEAPLLGRWVRPKRKRSVLMKTLFPASAPHTRWLLPRQLYLDELHTWFRVGIGGAFADDGGFRLYERVSAPRRARAGLRRTSARPGVTAASIHRKTGSD
jgi:hypothetical protein